MERRTQLVCSYALEGLSSLSACMAMNNIAFFTAQRFGWNAGQNLLLMMAQGALYAAGSLASGQFVERLSKPRTLLLIQAALLAIVLSLQFGDTPTWLIPLMLLYVPVSALTWPVVESLVTEGCGPARMARQITVYNMIWSGMNVVSTAVFGTILFHWPRGPLVIPIFCHVLGLVAGAVLQRSYREPVGAPTAHAHDEDTAAALAHSRRLALWLARISLPAWGRSWRWG
jgi:predicted MFS family arabinose efflux permease